MATKSTRSKDFGSPKREDVEPLVFTLYGEEYTAYPEIQGAKLLQFSQHVSSDNQSESTEALLGFFEEVLYPDSYAQLQVLWEDKERIVPIETLSEIISWLVEEYTDVPTPTSKNA